LPDSEQLLVPARLQGYLEAAMDGFRGPMEVEKFSDGQSNPTYLITTPTANYVLRRKPDGALLKSAHAVNREFRVMGALQNTSVPVPRVFHLCSDTAIFGTMFFVMEFVGGRIFWDPALPGLDKIQRAKIFEEMNRVLAELHSLDPAAVGLADFGRPGNYFARQVERWTRQYQLCELETIPEMNHLAHWLPRNIPADDGRSCLVHGDYRMDNMIFHPQRATMLALLDWELSTLGHPFADLAYQCMQLRLGDNDMLPGLGDRDRDVLGIPGEQEYVTAYCSRRNIDNIPGWNFFMAFSFFRFAAILQGVKKRALDGNASSDRAIRLAELITPLAIMAADETSG
jgi:aminoglycoside phosphotransferase (APT) family kinase protein